MVTWPCESSCKAFLFSANQMQAKCKHVFFALLGAGDTFATQT